VESVKAFNVRLPKSLWLFLKKKSVEQEKSMIEILIKLIEQYKKRCEKQLTHDDA